MRGECEAIEYSNGAPRNFYLICKGGGAAFPVVLCESPQWLSTYLEREAPRHDKSRVNARMMRFGSICLVSECPSMLLRDQIVK